MKEERIWNKGFTSAAATCTLSAIGFYMLIPTIPLFLVSLGTAESQVGMVATTFYISSISTRFLINAVLAKVGKKRILIAGLLLSTIAMALYSLVGSVGAATALRVIQGMGLGIATTITTTMAADFLPDSRRGQGLGYFNIGIVVAMTIGPALALYLRNDYGFMPMFLVAAGTNLLSAITVLLFTDEPRITKAQPQDRREEKEKAIQWRFLFDRKLIVPSAIVLLFGICRSVDLNYIALFAEAKALEHLSLYFIIQTATMFCIRLVVGRFADRKGRNWVLIPGGLAMLATQITLSFADTSAVMLLGAFFSGLGVGVLAPNLQVWMLSVIEPEKRNVASASYYSFMDTGSAIGAPLMGLMAENFGYTVMFRIGACAALLYIIAYIAIGREKKTLNIDR